MAATTTPPALGATRPLGLTSAAAAARLAADPPARRASSSRSYSSIVVANVLTVFNGVLSFFGVLTLVFGDPRDALFLGVVVANSAIGIVQEVRAKRTLDRLSALVAPTAAVLRDGEEVRLAPEAVVAGDAVVLAPGDQLVADGELADANALRLDESILTGESRPVPRRAGERVRSGSFVLEGGGTVVVDAVGEDSYAGRITGDARAFRHPRSPLERALNRLLLVLVAAMVPLALVLGTSLLVQGTSFVDAVPEATAAMVALVPEGLVLLASLTFAVAAVRMARQGALAQQLNAIESLASADVICLDKTGTLTDAQLRVVATVPAVGVDAAHLDDALARYAAGAAHHNGTLTALADRWPRPSAPARAEVPFTSRRRWSAQEHDDGTLVLGAPEVLCDGALRDRAAQEAASGRRVIALGAAPGGLGDADPDAGLPDGIRPLGLAVLAERLRDDAASTVAFLRREGVELKVLSGDAPATVAAIAADVGLGGGRVVDGSALPESDEELRALAREASVVGRIAPEGKRRFVQALADQGRYVAMVGDGVNDVPALKAARLAIAQGSGTQMAKSVADVVLLSGDFSAVPRMVEEGRRILRNVQRVARIFVAKAAFAALIILTVGTTTAAYPFLPRHLTVASTFGVGVPAFFLALTASHGAWRPDRFLRSVLGYAAPTGAAIGLGVLAAYVAALHLADLGVPASRTVATTVLLGGLLLLVNALERERRDLVAALCLAMAAGYAVVLAVAPLRRFFALDAPGLDVLAIAAGGSVLTWLLVVAALRLARRWA